MKEKDKVGGRTRANGEGSWRLKSGGKSVEFRWDGKSKTEPNAWPSGTKGDRQRDARLAELRSKPAGYKPKETVYSVGLEWIEHLEQKVDAREMQESTLSGYENTMKMIKRAFSNTPFHEATAKQLHDGILASVKTIRRKDKDTGLYVYTEGKYDIGTLRKMRVMLGQIYAFGVYTSRISPSEDPTKYIPEITTTERKASTKRAYTEQEVTHLLKSLPETDVGYAIRLCLMRGYRGQEIVMLKPEDIAEDGSTVQIHKALKRGRRGKYYAGVTKSKASDRTDHIPKSQRPWAIWLREHASSGYVLSNARGDMMTVEVWRKKYYATVRGVGIEPLAPHQMRHTATTTNRMRIGLDSRVVMELNGQADIQTMEKYNHVDRDAIKLVESKQDEYTRKLLGKKSASNATRRRFKLLGGGLGQTMKTASN